MSKQNILIIIVVAVIVVGAYYLSTNKSSGALSTTTSVTDTHGGIGSTLGGITSLFTRQQA